MRVKWSEIDDAFNFVNSGQPTEIQAFLCKETGKIYIRSDVIDVLDEVPEDPGESNRYIEIPHKNDLDLGRRLALDFASECLPDHFDEIRDIFARRGAYRRFKDLLHHHGALEHWYDFSNKAEEAALRRWCEENEIEIDDEGRS